MEKSLISKKLTIKNMVICSFCCSLTCVLAMFTVPIGVIPITLANLAIYISSGIFGGFRSSISQFLYLLLVFMGCPFTSKLVGGPAYFSGPTAGYMLGYVPMAFLAGVIYKAYAKRSNNLILKSVCLFLALAIGTMVCYFFGTVWFSLQTKKEFLEVLKICVFPFLVGDFIKIILSMGIILKMEKFFNKYN